MVRSLPINPDEETGSKPLDLYKTKSIKFCIYWTILKYILPKSEIKMLKNSFFEVLYIQRSTKAQHIRIKDPKRIDPRNKSPKLWFQLFKTYKIMDSRCQSLLTTHFWNSFFGCFFILIQNPDLDNKEGFLIVRNPNFYNFVWTVNL